jgi:glycosyltransferase involved in cell wall biosynthesis
LKTYTHFISNIGSINRKFQIIVPVYNEEQRLEKIFSLAKDSGYIKNIVFVDDASTDSSLKILKHWVKYEKINLISFPVNAKKEGAIKAAMDILLERGELRPYTMLLDADSFIVSTVTDISINVAIENAISYLNHNQLSALSFRIEATSDRLFNIFYMSAFSDFYGMQFDHWLTSKQSQVWVINGSGGLFKTQKLHSILNTIVPDFETGDLKITVELMKQNSPINYYPLIKINTFSPNTVFTYFNQRRRWERGTMKVMWYDRKFYLNNFRRPSILAFYTLLHFALYIGLFLTILIHFIRPLTFTNYTLLLGNTFLFWQTLNLLKGIFLNFKGISTPYFFFFLCVILHGFVWLTVTVFARLTGLYDAIVYFCNLPKKINN